MSTVWEDRFARYVAAVMGLRESTSLDLIPDVLPVLNVIDCTAPENRLARGEVLLSAPFDITGAAGQYPTVSVENPAGSNLLLVIDRLVVVSFALQSELRIRSVPGTAPGAPVSTSTDDERRPNSATRSRTSATSEVVAIGGRFAWLQVSVTLQLGLRHVLPPGFVWQAQGQTVANRIFGFVQGYERPAGAAELVLR